jgi:hypothetical protein
MATHTEFQHLSVAKRNTLPVFSIPWILTGSPFQLHHFECLENAY